MISAVIANTAFNKKKGKTYKVEDFMPKVKKKQTPEEMFRAFSRIAKNWGGSET